MVVVVIVGFGVAVAVVVVVAVAVGVVSVVMSSTDGLQGRIQFKDVSFQYPNAAAPENGEEFPPGRRFLPGMLLWRAGGVLGYCRSPYRNRCKLLG